MTLIFGAAFAAAYYFAADPVLRHVLIYFCVLAGLFISLYLPLVSGIVAVIGIVLLFSLTAHSWFAVSSGMAVILINSGIVPYFRRRREGGEARKCELMNSAMDERIGQLRRDCGEWEKERDNLEHEIERINQLYLQGRELVEHMEMSEVADHLCRVLQNRPGMRAVAMLGWEKDGWKPLYVSQPALRRQWVDFMRSREQLGDERQFRAVAAPPWAGADTIVLWPVRLENELLAAILLVTDREYALRYREEGCLFIPQIALGLQRAALFSEVRDRSRKDGLTGLYLRRYFVRRLNTEIMRGKRYASSFSLLMADIDHFKDINDTYGHLAGDHVLCSLASLFNRCVRPGDLVGRFGGEEFIILLPMVTPAEAVRMARLIHRAAAKEEYREGEARFHATLSIGISHFPQDGTTEESLRSAADQALYWVKTHGRNGIREYAAAPGPKGSSVKRPLP